MTRKSALQRDLDRFYKQLYQEDFNIREVTKGGLSQSRRKLNPAAFKRLNQLAVEGFYGNTEVYTWYGYRILAGDGTRVQLPNHPSVKKEFGEYPVGRNGDTLKSMGLGSMLYDVLNQMTIDSEIASYSASERDLLVNHLEYCKPGEDLILLDRGYPCFWLLFLLKAKGLEFCVRLKSDWWLEVKKFQESNEKEMIVEFSLPEKDYHRLKDYPQWQKKKIKCRLIKVVLDNGETEILCTSLTDTQKYSYDEFDWLYHKRWNEEEAYKLLKTRAELEDFSGKTSIAVKQDFYAKIFMMSLCAAFANPIEEKVIKEYKADGKNRKHDQKINRTHALATLYDSIIPMFARSKIKEGLSAFDDLVARTRERVIPDRHFPRKHIPKKPYPSNNKKL